VLKNTQRESGKPIAISLPQNSKSSHSYTWIMTCSTKQLSNLGKLTIVVFLDLLSLHNALPYMPEDTEGKYQMVYRKCSIGYEKPALRDGG
jgi:hypothetical protein